MSEKQRSVILLVLLVLSLALLAYVKTHIGQGFIKQL
jgi:hypothetical protein